MNTSRNPACRLHGDGVKGAPCACPTIKKVQYMVARNVEGELIPLHWTAADDKNAEQGIRGMVHDFNKDEAKMNKCPVKDLKMPFVPLKVTTKYEEI